MSKQGILVVSHPRSGSSEFIRTLAHFAANQLTDYRPVGLMAECFHWADATTFGDFARARLLEPGSIFPYQETVLEPNVDLLSSLSLAQALVENNDNVVWQDAFYRPVTKSFESHDDVRDYYIDQFQQRIVYVNETVVEEYFPIIKNFAGFINFYNDDQTLLNLQQSLVSKLTNIEPVFFYRKNLLDSVYSDLIKWYYIDQSLIDGDKKLNGFSGHNFNNTMPPLIPKSGVIIDQSMAQRCPETFCETLKNYQVNRKFFKNVISYDQVFVDKKFNLNFNGIDYLVTDHTNAEREYPMNYQTAKKDYFENPEIVIKAIRDTITRYDMWDIVDELEIVVE